MDRRLPYSLTRLNHALCPLQYCLNDVHINEVSKFLAESPSMTSHAIQLKDPFDTAHLLITPLQLSSVTSYLDVYSSSVAEYENQEISKIHLTAEESPWDSSTNEYSEREI